MTILKKGRKFAKATAGLSSAVQIKDKVNAVASDSAAVSSLGNDSGNLTEAFPQYVAGAGEKVVQGQNNSWLVFGRDRPGSIHSGKGGQGHTQAASVDLVVGRMSPTPKANFKYPGDSHETEVKIDPMFTPYIPEREGKKPGEDPVEWACDAARFLLSQKTNVDENFKLAAGQVGQSTTKSAYVLKADAGRIIANEGIKLITNPDGFNSYGSKIKSVGAGIDLICGNRDVETQPLLKGEDTRECFKRIIAEIQDLNSIVQGITDRMIDMNNLYGRHFHPPPVLYTPVTYDPMIETMAMSLNVYLGTKTQTSLKNAMTNTKSLNNQFCEMNGENYICSRYNTTN